MKFEKGKQYECVSFYGGSFTKNGIYYCGKDGWLLNNRKKLVPIPIGDSRFFKLHEPEPKLGDKVLVWDEENNIHQCRFFTKIKGELPYVVLPSERDYERYVTGFGFECAAYKNMKPLPQVETVSLKEALSILEAHKGVKCKIEGV